MKERDYVVVDGRIIIKLVLKQYVLSVWTGFIRLRLGKSSGLF
jgi:hypothetical protein